MKDYNLSPIVALDEQYKGLVDSLSESYKGNWDDEVHDSYLVYVRQAASKFEGNYYSDVVVGLRERGFTNIELQRLDDLKIGLFKKEGEISLIRINGNSSFDKESEFDYYNPVIIVVHTFPGQGCDDITILAN